MIRGYPNRASLEAGEVLVLHVSTDARRFRVTIYRWVGEPVPMGQSDWFPGEWMPEDTADRNFNWPAYTLPIPAGWPSSVYLACLQEWETAEPPLRVPATDRAGALFVIRGHGDGNLLYKIPLNTYHAYNCTGGGCFYNKPPWSEKPPGGKVSLQRPGGGIGGKTWGAADHYDSSSPRQTFAHWDAHFIRWLFSNGYTPEFCTDQDLHSDRSLCSQYRLLVSVGHDEYWSEPARDQVEDFIESGGNAAFFGANICWWRVHVVDSQTAIVCHQGGPNGARDLWWPESGADRPEDALTGVSYRHGGGWWDGPREVGGYVVQDAGHWAFSGTSLHNGESFGHDSLPPLVGYECDGAPIDSIASRTGIARLASNLPLYRTPPRFRALAVAALDERWQELPPREGLPASAGVHNATMGTFERGAGRVFTAGTVDWAQVLASGHPVVERITRNVIDQLLAEPEGRSDAVTKGIEVKNLHWRR